jgi:hypothetical protein
MATSGKRRSRISEQGIQVLAKISSSDWVNADVAGSVHIRMTNPDLKKILNMADLIIDKKTK